MSGIQTKAKELGLKFKGQERIATSKYQVWEEWEDDLIRDHYPYYGTRMPYLHHRKANAINVRAQKLGVKYVRRSRKTKYEYVSALELYRKWEKEGTGTFPEWLNENKWRSDYRNVNKEEQ